MTAPVWFRMLRQSGFHVSPSRYYLVLLISVASLFNWVLAAIQQIALGRRIGRTQLRDDPIFILGHWRSGTTFVHELLALDERHTVPTTYACLAPSHFLISQKILGPCLRFLLPSRRSQDDVRVDLEHPQEDEWALCVLGLPSPYRAAAFPNHLPHAPDYVTLQGIDVDERSRWKRTWRKFLQAVVFRDPTKRLIIKSPLHTARIELLLELFPKARFVHLVRDPHSVYPSTLRLWQRLAEDEGLQVPQFASLEKFVFETYLQLNQSFLQNRPRIHPDRLCHIRYEDLVADPVGSVRSVYTQFDLGDFDAVLPAVEAYLAEMTKFQTNRFQLSEEETQEIHLHWGEFIQRYGYAADRAA